MAHIAHQSVAIVSKCPDISKLSFLFPYLPDMETPKIKLHTFPTLHRIPALWPMPSPGGGGTCAPGRKQQRERWRGAAHLCGFVECVERCWLQGVAGVISVGGADGGGAALLNLWHRHIRRTVMNISAAPLPWARLKSGKIQLL